MAVRKPDTYRHNNDTEPFVLPFDYQVGASVVTTNDLLSLFPKKINVGGLVYVSNKDKFYQLIDKAQIGSLSLGWREFKASAGLLPKSILFSPTTVIVSDILEYAKNRINGAFTFFIENNEFPFLTFPTLADNKIFIITFNGININREFGQGTTPIVKEDLQIVGERILNLQNLDDPTTDRILLEDIGTSKVWTFIASGPLRTIQGQEEGYTVFEATQNGIQKAWFYVGQTGNIGTGAYQPVESDFNLIPVGDSIIEQVINLGGSYPNLSLEGNIIVFTNTNAQAILKGIDPSVYKRITIVNNGGFTLGVESESTDAGVISEHRIKLPTGNAFVGLEGTTEFGYVNSIKRWQILDSFASKWIPAHRGLTEEEVLKVGEGGVSSTGKIFQLIDFRDAQSSPMTKTDLNAAYDGVFRGFQVVCKVINKIYIKVDESANDWQEINTTDVL